MARYYESQWPAYVSVAERRLKAERAAAKLSKKGSVLSPVIVEGRKIAATFWGKAWCDNLESYRDYAEPVGARTQLRAQWSGDRSANRAAHGDRDGQRIIGLHRQDHDRRGAEAAVEIDLRRLRGRHRLARRIAARPVFQRRDGADLPPGHRPVPKASGDQILLQLPGLRLDVQARRGFAVGRRRSARCQAGVAVPAARRGRE